MTSLYYMNGNPQQSDYLAATTSNFYSSTSGTAYAMMNALAFRPGELDKLRQNDIRLDDCRSRRKAAILKARRLITLQDNSPQ